MCFPKIQKNKTKQTQILHTYVCSNRPSKCTKRHYMNLLAAHLKPSQHCSSAILQYKTQSLKDKTKVGDCTVPVQYLIEQVENQDIEDMNI